MFRFPKSTSLAALVLALFAFSLPLAHAHAHPKVMDPAPESSVPAPAKITVSFSEPVEGKFSSLSLTDEQGKKIGKDPSQAVPGDPKTLVLPVPTLAPGAYLVHWVSVAADGHRMEGEYKFNVK